MTDEHSMLDIPAAIVGTFGFATEAAAVAWRSRLLPGAQGLGRPPFVVRILQLPVNPLDYGQSWSKRATSLGQTEPQAGIASQRITGSSTSTNPK
jgi:hypothetical protein